MLYRNFILKASMVALFLWVSLIMYSQDIEEIGKAPILAGNGGVSLSQIAQYTPDTINNISSYSYYLSGNMNLNILGVISLPMSFAYTNSQTTANLANPFNRFSLSPSYKCIQAHIGYSSMNYSPYTLSGHEFFGGGVELEPNDQFRISAMYGRFRKAVVMDSLTQEASYKRLGGAFLLGYKNDNIDVTVNLLKAKDDKNSIRFEEKDSLYISPEDNLAGSIAIKLKLANHLSIESEYGVSAVNRDISKSDSLGSNILLVKNGDLAVYHAFRSNITQSSEFGQLGVTYERIAPNYNAFGAYYYTNDFENITIDLSSSLIRWLNWSANAGYQRDNLENQKSNTNKRAIFSVNTTTPISNKIVLGLNFSNIQSFVHIKDIYNEITQSNEFQNLDTLNFTQLNMTAGANFNYTFKADKTQRHNFSLGFNYQEASEQQEDNEKYTGNQIYNSMIAYQYALIPIRFNLSTSVNHNQNILPDTKMSVLSYSLSIQKSLGTNLKTAVISTYSNSFKENNKLSDVVNVRMNAGYRFKKRHSFNLSLAMVSNQSVNRKTRMYSANLNYNYIFDFKIDRKARKTSFEGSF